MAGRAFTEHDFHDVLMDDVARRCGVAKGTLYLYFPSKQQLYSAAMSDGLDELCRTLESVAAAEESPLERLRSTLACLLLYFRRRRVRAFLSRLERAVGAADERRWLRGRARVSRFVRATLADAIAAGALRAIDLRVGEELVFAIVRGLNGRGARGPAIDRLANRGMDIFLRGAGRPVEPRKRAG